MRRRDSSRYLSGALLVIVAMSSAAEERRFGAYDVHYSVFAADFLQPPVAAALDIVRAPDRAVLNVAVRRRVQGSTADTPVAAAVSGTTGDLIRKTPLVFREVEEGAARYYLAQFPVINGETVYFELQLQPQGEKAALELRFEKTLYVD